QLRLERLAPLDLARVRLTPSEALGRIDDGLESGRLTLLSVMDRPAYRIGGPSPATIFADTGEVLDTLSVAQSKTIASRFMNVPDSQIEHAGTVTSVDQWT